MNSPLFDKVYFNDNFQKRLVLKVIDEAHMINSWGLVASGKAKFLSSHPKGADRAVFRPSYGNLGARFMASNHVPVLLMSATCRPVAVEGIKKSLRMPDQTLHMLRGELACPEVRLIRVTMKHSMKSCDDLLVFYPLKSDVPDHLLPPTLIYSTSQNNTWITLSVCNRARGTPRDRFNGRSTFGGRYHAATGEKDKIKRASDFAQGSFSLLCCTMALGLGQNWKRVRRVIHVGRGDPSCIEQMLGRCGRDGKLGLGILLVEDKRRNGKNKIEDFNNSMPQTDDDRMDALAITPVCLRIALCIDNWCVCFALVNVCGFGFNLSILCSGTDTFPCPWKIKRSLTRRLGKTL